MGDAVELIVDPGLCRCCGVWKRCRVLNFEYEHRSGREVYSDMIYKCFGVEMKNLDGPQSGKLICAGCVMRLRDSCNFRLQMMKFEEKIVKSGITEGNLTTKNVLNNDSNESMSNGDAIETIGDTANKKERENDSLTPLEDIRKQAMAAKSRLLTLKVRKLSTKMSPSLTCKNIESKTILRNKINRKIMEENSKEVIPKYSFRRYTRSEHKTKIFENIEGIVKNSYAYPFDNNQGIYRCYYCKKIYLNPTELRDHTMAHDTDSFEIHYFNCTKKKTLKLDVSNLSCRWCEKKINTIDNLKSHLSTEHGKKFHDDVKDNFLQFNLSSEKLECLECGLKCLFIDKLIKHMSVHFGNCICEICGDKFVQESSLISHVRNHRKIIKKYNCSLCPKQLSSNRTLVHHMATVHEKKCIIKCFYCTDVFTSYAARIQHAVESHGVGQSYECNICGKKFMLRRHFVTHMKFVHGDPTRPYCNVCKKKFKSINQLKLHNIKAHDVDC